MVENGQNLTLKDFNFNLTADRYMYIDPKDGIVLTTKSADGKSDNFVQLVRAEDKSKNVRCEPYGHSNQAGRKS